MIIGYQVLPALGCDHKAILTAVCDKHNGVNNVFEALAWNTMVGSPESGQIPSTLKGVTFHSGASELDDRLTDTKVYIDLDDDEPAHIDNAFRDPVSDAQRNLIS